MPCGATFDYQFDAATTASYVATGLPPGITLDARTGHLGGKPTRVGSYSAFVGAINRFGFALTLLNVTVKPAPATTAPPAPHVGG